MVQSKASASFAGPRECLNFLSHERGAPQVFAREFLRIRTRLRMRRAVGVAFKCDRRYGDHWSRSKPFFKFVIFAFATSQSETPAIIMYSDRNVIRIVERRSAAIERGVIEVPFRRSESPNELGKIVPISVVACPASLRRKLILLPPLEFSRWRQRHTAGFLAPNQITTHRDHGFAALRPKRRDDVGGARAPIKPSNCGLVDLKRIHQRDGIESHCRGLAI